MKDERALARKPSRDSGNEAARKEFFLETPTISLPTGGGAIRSIDEKFSVNAANGTATFELPLPFSKARNGFVPPVRIGYDSGAGNGLLGVGWSLDFPSIRRRTDRKLPRYRDLEDVFLFSAAEDLVPALSWDGVSWKPDRAVDGDYLVERFRPRIEGVFSRIERLSHPERGVWWRVTSGDNVTTLYGISDASRIADPATPENIFEWLPAITYDDQGNCLVYEYKPEDLDGVPPSLAERNRHGGIALFTNKHLKRLKYGNRVPVLVDEMDPYRPLAPGAEFLFEAVFDYGEHDLAVPTPDEVPGRIWGVRTDAFSSYRSGFEIRTYRLLRRVLMFHRFDELANGEPCLTRALELDYVGSSDDSPQATELTYLKSATESGFILKPDGAYSRKSLPALELEYEPLSWDTTIRTVDRDSVANLPTGADGAYQWMDLDGEGISGIFTEQAAAWFYKANLGDTEEDGRVRFDAQRLVAPKPSFTGVATAVLQLRELEADGQKQIVVQSPELQGYFERSDEEEWLPLKPFPDTIRVDLSDANVRLLDLDGDGRAEIVVSEENAFVWYESDGKRGYKSMERTAKPYDEERGPVIVFSDGEQKIFLADMSGDGLTDIVRIRRGDVCYWPNLGYGRFGAKVAMDNAPLFGNPHHYNPDYLQLADVSGTGATDILYLGQNHCQVYLNLGGNAWSDTQPIAPFFSSELPNRVAVTDLLGNGTACIVWSSPLPAFQNAPMRYIDLMGGRKPHLLRKYVNNLGKEVTFSYKSSTWYYLKDKVEGRSWVTRLPFPVYCLRRVEVRDRISGARFASEYRYHHGYFDRTEREFRGFGMVETRDTEEFQHWAKSDATNVVERPLHQAPVLTKSWYHTGAFLGREKMLKQFRDEYWDRAIAREGFDVDVDEASLPEARLVAAPGIDPDVWDAARSEILRDALRSCKGMVLRREVFALDAPDVDANPDERRRQLTPYTVSTHNCVIELLQPRQGRTPAVFTVKESEAITWSYERVPSDPRVEHTLNVRVDELGNVLESATVLYGRRVSDLSLPVEVRERQHENVVTYHHHELTGDAVGPGHYRLRRPSRTSSYEIRGLTPAGALYTIGDFDGTRGFQALIDAQEIPTHEHDREPPPGTVFLRLLRRKQTLYYDETLRAPLPLHNMNVRGLSFESYELAFTPALLTDIFGARVGDALMSQGRYTHLGDTSWWVPSGRLEYLENGEVADAARDRFFAPVAHVDAYGARTRIRYLESYFLLVRELEDAAQNRNTATAFDFHRLSPRRLVDANDNITEVLLDELGWVKASALLGKGGEAEELTGHQIWTTPEDTAAASALFGASSTAELTAAGSALLQRATTRHVYDVERYKNSGGSLPPVLATIVRERHFASDPDSPIQISFEYSNGMGKVAMTKVQAEPGPAKQTIVEPDGTFVTEIVDTAALVPPALRWLGTGRKVLNNKGNTVKEYEPYFSVTQAFEDRSELVEAGVTIVSYYDPLDRVVRTDHPDGTFRRSEYSAWKLVEHDRNDTVLESNWYDLRVNRRIDAELTAAGKSPLREAEAATQSESHAATPFTQHFDVFGRPLEDVEHNGQDGGGQDVLYRSRWDRDREGRTLRVTDDRGNVVVSYKYDMRGELSYLFTMDSGRRWMLEDVLGEPLRSWDERGHEFVFSYDDPLHRLTTKRVMGGDGLEPLDHVFERRVYGEGRANDRALNLRTRIAVLYDTAGKTENEEFDFKGNLRASNRRFAADYKGLPNWSSSPLDALLETEPFASTATYDALNRVLERTTPDGSVYRPGYNQANLLETVEVTQGPEPDLFVKSIDYNEKGQRQRIRYGNDVETRYTYDRETFRLIRLTSRKGGGELLQDCDYTYDPVGNLTHLEDRSVPVVWFDNQRTTGLARYRYDALYRLTRATGREHAGQLSQTPADNWNDLPFLKKHSATDPFAWRNYSETYVYDSVGNLTQMAHVATGGGWTRDYIYAPDSNRLRSTQVGTSTYAYSHHLTHGQMSAMPHLSRMSWNFRDELQAVATQVVDAGTPETTWYVYDGDGKRVRKITERQSPGSNKKSERYYLDGVELYREYDAANALTAEESTFVVMDDQGPVARVEREVAPSVSRLVRYQCLSHLGSSTLETDASAKVISYEEYHPFGTTAYQAVEKNIVAAAKRYRYTGLERDEESGLEYHSARYYVPWLGRWTAPDRHAERLTGNRYAYVKNNPVVHTDRNGLFEEPVHGALTYRLALAAGFTQADAARIAIATAGMDHDEATRPGDGLWEMMVNVWKGITHAYHYPSQQDALARVETAIDRLTPGPDSPERRAALDAFGRHLHSLQDVGFVHAPGPHARGPNNAGGAFIATGGSALGFGFFAIYGAVQIGGGFPEVIGAVALAIVGGLLAAAGLYLVIFGIRAMGTGHPDYTTEIRQRSEFTMTTADQAFQDPDANRREMLEIYEILKRAAVEQYGSATSNDAQAREAIEEVVTADNEARINAFLNQCPTDALGNPVPSYAEVVKRQGRWAPRHIDVSLERGEFNFRGAAACPR